MTDEERNRLREKMRAKARAEAENEMMLDTSNEEEILYQQMLEEERQKLRNDDTVRCPFCGSIISAQAVICPMCRMKLNGTTPVVVNNVYRNNDGNSNGEGFATASLVLGLIGVVLLFVNGSLVSIILGIIGLSLASVAKSKGYVSSKRTAGFVLSLLSLIFGVIVFAYWIFVLHWGLSVLGGLLGRYINVN